MDSADPRGESEQVQQWIAAARRGSREAMGQLMQVCRQYLLLVANRELDTVLQAKAGASDLVQETFLEAQRDFHHFRGETQAELLAWFRRILLHNVANTARRYRHAGKRNVTREKPLQSDGSGRDLAHVLTADITSPSNQAIRREEAEALERALERLPADYQQVIVLRLREKRPLDEVGRLMNRSPDAVRMLWARAVERLTEELGLPHGQ